MLAKAKSAAESAVLSEVNAARADPKAYAVHVKALLDSMEGDLIIKNGGLQIRTNEGPVAVRDALSFLETAPKAPAMSLADGLCAAARDHAADLRKSGGTGHNGSDGSDPFSRISRHGKWLGSAAENIAFGDGSARDRVVQLIVDDGVASRGHRTNIFNPAFLRLGVAEGAHPEFGSCCVQTFAAEFKEGTDAAHTEPSTATSAASSAAPSAAPASAPSSDAAATPAAPAAPAQSAASDGAAKKPEIAKPIGGRIDKKTSIVTQGNKRTTTTTTIVTQADGSSSTTVETKVETL